MDDDDCILWHRAGVLMGLAKRALEEMDAASPLRASVADLIARRERELQAVVEQHLTGELLRAELERLVGYVGETL